MVSRAGKTDRWSKNAFRSTEVLDALQVQDVETGEVDVGEG